MGCPFIIQPHQIRGLDYPQLFPVIQWLVNQVLSFQHETAEFTQKQAALQFEKVAKQPALEKLRDFTNLFLPKRKFKTVSNRKLNDPIRVFAALLEFGDTSAGNAYQQYVNVNKEKTKESMSKDAAKPGPGNRDSIKPPSGPGFSERKSELPGEKPSAKGKEEKPEENLLEMETEKVELRKSITVIGRNVAKIVKSEDISEARNMYLDVKKEENPEIMQKKLEKEREERLITTLTKEIELSSENLEKLQILAEEIKKEVEKHSGTNEDEKNMNARIKETIANLEENTREARAAMEVAVATGLEVLVAKRNKLKESQKVFKDKCNREIEELNKKNDQDMDTDVQEWFDKIDKSYNDTLSRYEKARAILAERNQEVAILQRKLESKPSQTELTQFQRRFVELYEQINLKVEENRRYFASYNTLIEVRNLLESEISTLDSFQQGFKQCKKKSEKEGFAESVSGGIIQIAEKIKKAQEKHKNLQETLKELEKKYKDLEEIERTYYQMVKEFNELIGN